MPNATVYGESVHSIVTTLSKGNHRITESGMHELELHMTPDEAGPVIRAVMRAEAELLSEDADAFDPKSECRTPAQRRADALSKVVTQAAAALGL